MFFFVSKVLEPAFQPTAFLLLLGLAGIGLSFVGGGRLGRRLAGASIVLLAVISFSPLGSLLIRPLENRFPPPDLAGVSPAGIIVLGGSIDADVSAARGEPTLNDAAARLTTGVALAHRFSAARLVFTGGTADLEQKNLDEAGAVRKLWLSLGVPPERMIFESGSRNTFENATHSRALVAPKPGETWLLVTSAAHMPRSVGIFRKVGWPVIPFPTDYRTYGDARDFAFGFGVIDALSKTTSALHEWIGLIAYRLTGKTDSLFPAPDADRTADTITGRNQTVSLSFIPRPSRPRRSASFRGLGPRAR